MSTGFSEWLLHQGPGEIANENGKHYAFTKLDVEYDEIVIYVWLTVQKLSYGNLNGTASTSANNRSSSSTPGRAVWKGSLLRRHVPQP